MVLITDASDKGGGGTLFQWQKLSEEQTAHMRDFRDGKEDQAFSTSGIKADGTLCHNYPHNYVLVPIGHWSWKWSPTRSRYMTYEQELLAGVLTIASQFRLLAHTQIVWFCDNEALKSFLSKEPPTNARLRRWYCFLCQFCLTIFHIPGLKNEMCDWLSRQEFDKKINDDFERVAQDAFVRMDNQLDLSIKHILVIMDKEIKLEENDYIETELKTLWEKLVPFQAHFEDDKMYYRTKSELFCERKVVIPRSTLTSIFIWLHRINGHPSSERTTWFFLQHFTVEMTRKELLAFAKQLLVTCETCLKAKPNTQVDRGLVSALPIPQLSNDLLYVDFIQMDPYNHFDYVLTIVDALTRFVQFIPCTKNITGEGTLKLILKEWIQHYGKPREILSDNDVRFSQEKGFYQSAFKSLGIDTHFGLPRRPQSNGICERTNRSFIQNARALSIDCKTMDWPKLCPLVTWIMNSQISSQTGYSPSDLFLGRPSWNFSKVPEPCSNPCVENWLSEQLILQEKATRRLTTLRERARRRANKGRVQTSYSKGDYVLVHKSRWPQKKIPKLESPWYGPFRVHEVHFNSLVVMASPSLGGLVKVSLSMIKRWRDVFDLDEEEEVIVPEEEEEQVEEMNDDEMAEEGFYNVESILKHKFQQGWRFLVKWEGYPVENSTWEPVKNFIQSSGVVNSKFKEYCLEKGLEGVLQKALGRR